MSKKKSNKSARMPLLTFYMGLLVVSLYLFMYHVDTTTNYYGTLAVGFAGGFSSYGPITLLGVMAVEFAPKSLSGTSHSLVTLAANLGAVCAGLPFSALSKAYTWHTAFVFIQLPLLLTLALLCVFRNSDSIFVIVKPGKDKSQ
jgi:OPA family glycerol-6-phosphate transporter-like MFS transporter 4